MKFVDSRGNEYEPTSWLTFNDVLLRPQKSRFKSRNDKEILLQSYMAGYSKPQLSIPIISANMDTVTGAEMAIEMHALGGMGILHRFYSDLEEYKAEIREVFDICNRTVAFSVGCGSDWINFSNQMVEELQPTWDKRLTICLDVAHGHMTQSIETVKELNKLENVDVIAGNVATKEGAIDLADAGAETIKVGIGSGSVCTTRIITGHGVPQLSAIIDVRSGLSNSGFHSVGIIADGGIRNSGDIVKALAAGADAVMLGSMLAGCDETPGEVYHASGKFKLYRGQSSRHFLSDRGKNDVTAEGEAISVRSKGSIVDVIKDIVGGIRSGMTYSGASDITDLQKKAEFIEISHHGWVESKPHALLET